MTTIMERLTGAAAAGTAALALSACGPTGQGSATPASPPPGPWTSAAAAYIASHPVPARPGLNSGILLSFDESAPEAPQVGCTLSQGCYRWNGTVAEYGAHAVQVSTRWSQHPCASLETLSLDDYFYWSASRDSFGCPLSVVIIKRAAISAVQP